MRTYLLCYDIIHSKGVIPGHCFAALPALNQEMLQAAQTQLHAAGLERAGLADPDSPSSFVWRSVAPMDEASRLVTE